MTQRLIHIEEKKVVRKALNLFFVLFVFFGCLLGGMVAIFYQSELGALVSEIESQQSAAVALEREDLSNEFDNIVSDLLFFAGQNELREYLDTDNTKYLKGIENEYLELLVHKKMYDQIRFIDSSGMEVVRINYNKDGCCIVPTAKLQNKGTRYYFTESIKLGAGEVYVSPMDLNVEDGQIEEPLKPMVRFATPVFDSTGKKRGIIIINYLAQGLLDCAKDMGKHDVSVPMLVNKDGYWLLSNNSDDEWGFMMPNRKDRTFSNTYPEEWQKMVSSNSGQLNTKQGLFTFVKIFPLQQAFTSSSGSTEDYIPSTDNVDPDEYYWVLLTHVPRDVMWKIFSGLQVRLFLFGAGLFFVITLVAWFLAMAITKRRIYQSQLISMALYDSLTGLPNRKLFFERLERGLKQAERYNRRLGVLYIDLDGFKDVNDTLGHDAGDELLIKVSKLIESVTRKADTVARLGGDEFAVILTEINSLDGGDVAGNKIISALSTPIELKAGEVSIGASIGVAVYPDVSTDLETLVKSADRAMYSSKKKGKNNCTSALSEAPC